MATAPSGRALWTNATGSRSETSRPISSQFACRVELLSIGERSIFMILLAVHETEFPESDSQPAVGTRTMLAMPLLREGVRDRGDS